MPAQTGSQFLPKYPNLDSRVRGNDGSEEKPLTPLTD